MTDKVDYKENFGIMIPQSFMTSLCECVETLKSIDEMKNKIRGENKSRDEISNLFMQLT